jgi:hypothetical protein
LRRPATRSCLSVVFVALAALAATHTPALAGDTQDAVASRWRGAWVITTAETHADCAGFYTGNRVGGRLLSSKGRWHFRPGELAKIDGIDLKRNRVDVRMTLAEPLLVPHQDGPFTLYDTASCRMELQVEVPRDFVKGKDVGGLDRSLRVAIERYETESEARASLRYNRRERDPYPDDYERTLADHAAWQARQANAAVQARINALVDDTSRISDRITGDQDYMAGFVRGVEAGRATRPDSCTGLMSLGTGPVRVASDYRGAGAVQAGQSQAGVRSGRGQVTSEPQARYDRGYTDGVRLAQGLDAIRRLPGCFVPVPGE